MNDIRKKAIEYENKMYGFATSPFVDGFVNGYQQGRADAIDEYTEWLRKSHANFDEDYAEDIKSDYLEQLKGAE